MKVEQSTEVLGLGQRIGRKGRRTRQALIDATVELLARHGLREVSVADVARAAKTSPATFYVYFRGVPEVVLAALESANQDSDRLAALMERDWLDGDGLAPAFALVDEYVNLWAVNGTIFRIRNLAAEEGDTRFYEARMRAAQPSFARLAPKIAAAQCAGRVPAMLEPRACVGTLLMMLERLAAIGPASSGNSAAPAFEDLKRAAAFTLATMLGAQTGIEIAY